MKNLKMVSYYSIKDIYEIIFCFKVTVPKYIFYNNPDNKIIQALPSFTLCIFMERLFLTECRWFNCHRVHYPVILSL